MVGVVQEIGEVVDSLAGDKDSLAGWQVTIGQKISAHVGWIQERG